MTDYGALKLLLVEDNQHMRSIVMAILKGTGLRHIREARDGAEALEILRQYDADIALVDFNMQPIDGVEFTRMLRNSSDSPNPYLPVVMITGHSEKSRVMEARDAGVNEFVVKPLTARALLGRLDNIIMRPRPFIRCSTYFGPDRRRKTDTGYNGPFRRNTDGMF
ncbi:response regulator [Asticcacaulis machinosus]|uniref:Response regulator n=1 Tax=Asticcacaulis machinosus TaxID=2984211 RepID=A0ABT5HG91_9CAUL|nr:response regulator [Asticcacaulis machinosus]MDC7675274.1 response regulator [Asticcacaulis machinosus]